jgi:hypothetical protein
VPFCGHAVLEALSGSAIHAPDPMATAVTSVQPNARLAAFHQTLIADMAKDLGL